MEVEERDLQRASYKVGHPEVTRKISSLLHALPQPNVALAGVLKG